MRQGLIWCHISHSYVTVRNRHMFTRFRNPIFLFVANTFIDKQSFLVSFIGGHFENMQIIPLPGVRFMETFFLALTIPAEALIPMKPFHAIGGGFNLILTRLETRIERTKSGTFVCRKQTSSYGLVKLNIFSRLDWVAVKTMLSFKIWKWWRH